jgi:hypothetical protein
MGEVVESNELPLMLKFIKKIYRKVHAGSADGTEYKQSRTYHDFMVFVIIYL